MVLGPEGDGISDGLIALQDLGALVNIKQVVALQDLSASLTIISSIWPTRMFLGTTMLRSRLTAGYLAMPV